MQFSERATIEDLLSGDRVRRARRRHPVWAARLGGRS
jgi:hypothetical protein